MHVSKNLSCKIHNYIFAVNHGISCAHLISSKIFNLAKGETHIEILDTDSYTYLFAVNVIMIVLLIHQQKRRKHF